MDKRVRIYRALYSGPPPDDIEERLVSLKPPPGITGVGGDHAG